MRSDLEQALNWPKVRTELSRPNPGFLDNVGSLLVNIRVEREDRRGGFESVFVVAKVVFLKL